MFHPYARIAGYFDEVLDGYRGPGNCIWSQEFYETDRTRGFVRGYTFEFSRGQGPVMAAVHGMQIWAAAVGRVSITGLIAGCSVTGPGWWRSARTCPEEHNTVTLDPVLEGFQWDLRRRRFLIR